jgi:fatty acid-binding protein DegV
MEDELDKIINAKMTKNVILNELYEKIKFSVETANVDSVNAGGTNAGGEQSNKEKKTGILTTRYGVCYYNKELDKYTNIEPFLKWKKKGKDELTEEYIRFVSSLTKPIEYLGKKYNLHLGKYGIYLKDNKNNNHKLDKKLWNNYC